MTNVELLATMDVEVVQERGTMNADAARRCACADLRLNLCFQFPGSVSDSGLTTVKWEQKVPFGSAF